MNFGFIQINQPENIIAAQKQNICAYAQQNNLPVDDYILSGDITRLGNIPNGSTIIISEIIRLGSSLSEIKERITALLPRYKIISAAENIVLNFPPEILPEIISGIDLAITIQKKCASYLSRQSLSALKASGVRLGPPPGKKQNTKLKHSEEQIRSLLAQGIKKAEIARRLKLSRASIYNFMRRHKL